MKTRLFHILFAMAIATGVFAGYASAAPAQKAAKDKSTLVDEAAPATQAEPAANQDAGTKEPAANDAESTQAAQKSPACENAAPEKKSDIPIFPIVISSIGTIAFIVLAIIF